ncbi:MAG: SCP2 sterol-binding domain-containing protein [Gammaproteobacteria bacterium]
MTPTTTLATAVESALNQWIKLDSSSYSRLEEIQGKMIEWQMTEPRFSLFFFIETNGIQVLSQYEGEADTRIITSAAGIGQVMSGNPDKALFKGLMKIEGDTEAGAAFQNILKKVDFDWEEQLSRLTGDIIAHHAGSAFRSINEFISQTQSTLHDNVSEYLTEEIRLLPARSEVDYFLNQIDNLRADTSRLEARVERLRSRRRDAQ